MSICKACIFWNRESNAVQLPDGTEIVQSGEILNVGGTGKIIAKCTNNSNFWENITRAILTAAFFDDPAEKSVMNHLETMASAEGDTCPLYSDRLVTSITVSSMGDVENCNNGGNLQMLQVVLPTDAVDTSYTWSVINGTGTATIGGGSGILTGTSLGTVTARCTANDASGVFGEMEINIIEFITSIVISGFGGATTVAVAATLQMETAILPLTATIQIVEWSVINGSGSAAIDSFGLLTGGSVGTVTVRATATDGSGVFDDQVITVI